MIYFTKYIFLSYDLWCLSKSNSNLEFCVLLNLKNLYEILYFIELQLAYIF